MKLLKKINGFYKYNFESTTLTKNDMYDYEVLTSTLKDIEFTMSLHDTDTTEYKWLADLYADITTWIDNGYSTHNSFKIDTIVKLIASILGILGIGMFATAMIEYGIYFETVVGLALGIILAVCGGISVYQNIIE